MSGDCYSSSAVLSVKHLNAECNMTVNVLVICTDIYVNNFIFFAVQM